MNKKCFLIFLSAAIIVLSSLPFLPYAKASENVPLILPADGTEESASESTDDLFLVTDENAALIVDDELESLFPEGETEDELPEEETEYVSDEEFFYAPLIDHVQGHNFFIRETKEVQPDFEDLYAQNSHLIGWLKVGDIVDNPVLLYDNEYYLHHDFNRRPNINGTLFLDEWNLLDPRDWILFIYGHHMRDGSMFGRLQAYEDSGYLYAHPLITFRTIYDEEDVYYVPVAGFNASMDEKNPQYFDLYEAWYMYYDEKEKIRLEEGGEEPVQIPEIMTEETAAETADDTDDMEEIDELLAEAEADKLLFETEADGLLLEAESDGLLFKTQADGLPTEIQTESLTELLPDNQPLTLPGKTQGTPAETEPVKKKTPAQKKQEQLERTMRLNERIDERKRAHLKDMLDRSLWTSPAGASINDEYLILITCSYYTNDGRFLLLCRKLRDDETPEDITQLFAG